MVAAVAAAGLTAWASAEGAQGNCKPTPADSEGPFYVRGAPERSQTGTGFVVFGTVRSQDCRPIGGATIEWWSAGPKGEYDAAHRATTRADGGGLYRYETDFPGRYPGRPPHLHVKVAAPGHRTLVTQIYPAAGQTSLPVDLVLVRE
jgi:protocatechuate 3,4-dioxygenase beta subunit